MNKNNSVIHIRNTETRDFSGIIQLSQQVYPEMIPWSEKQLASHLEVFPEGQFVAVQLPEQIVVGMAASLIILWDDYEIMDNWRDFTDNGMFTNHDPQVGRTLYGAEVMVRPGKQGRGIGSRLYTARRKLVKRLDLLRIRAGARIRGYHRYASKMNAEEYVIKVIRKEIRDPTLSFQLHQGFHVIAVVPGYLPNDKENLGFAAVIEWLNPKVARPEDFERIPQRFRVPSVG